MIIKGKVIKLGDNINTDIIIPGRYLVHTDPQVLAEHVLEGLDPTFHEKARSGIIIVAGRNFGCGSSREQAPIALKHAGVKAVIAKSFARIFYRNSINIGLPVVELEDVNVIVDGEYIEVDLAEGYVKRRDGVLRFKKYPQMVMDILRSNGIVNYIRSRLYRQ